MDKKIRAYETALPVNYATYTYTDNGQRETVKDANDNLSTFEYGGSIGCGAGVFQSLVRAQVSHAIRKRSLSVVTKNTAMATTEAARA